MGVAAQICDSCHKHKNEDLEHPPGYSLVPNKPRTRYISIIAEKYSYLPSTIVANKGDTIVLRLSSQDVPHGFLLDGYPIDPDVCRKHKEKSCYTGGTNGWACPWNQFLTYLSAIWGTALVVFPGLFILGGKGANRLAGNPVNDREMTLRFSYILIPMGIFAWIAFSLPAVMVNYGHVVSVLSDPLGLGWDLFHTANVHFYPVSPEWILGIQGIIILAGLYFGLSRVSTGLEDLISAPGTRLRVLLLPALFALLTCNIFLKLYAG